MHLIDSGSTDPHEAIACDIALFRTMEDNGGAEALHFWESRRTAVIIGLVRDWRREVREDICRADGVPIIRRSSGGGSVLIAPGCLNYSLVLSLTARPELRDVRRSFGAILGSLVGALNLPGLSIRGVSDLALDERKVSGTAQRRGRRALLHHGTFLYAFPIRSIERYLKEPPRQPAYRAGRHHAAFVTNAPLEPDAIKAGFTRAWATVL